ncbi:MAG: FAD-dependent oxidoreductase [Oscillospiraceae bacterium]|nr:FAD-dependent oxidoreductase [Oscillospiraceae bacterium]
MKYPRLFSPIEVKPGFSLKNRIIQAAMHCGFTPDGTPTPQFREYYKARARGGAGLLIVGACRFEGTGARPNVMRLVDDGDVALWRPFVDEIHALDAKIAVQLFHAGRYVASGQNADGTDALSPSAVYSSFSRSTPREITVEEIHRIVEEWAAGAVRAQRAGFDAVEIIGSAGYLISQFLSPVTNLRTDDYGGSPENRRRFPLEVIRAVRAAVGPDYPVLFRLSGKDFIPGSNGLEEAKQFAALAQQAGVDLLNVTGGWHETTVPQLPGDLPRGGLRYLAAGIREAVTIPVSMANRISTAAVAEELLATEQADLVSMGRVLLADPELPNKARMGRADEIRPCVACNQGCLVGAFFDRPVCCLANGLGGREFELAPAPRKGDRVLVAGGGPAGCECAIRLAERGYRVTLWEAGGALGGQLNLAARCPAKGEFGTLVRYFATMLTKHGVEVRLHQIATAEAIQAAGFDRVVVAVGGQPNPVPLRSDSIQIVTGEEILTGAVIPGKHVVIVGGSFKGVEVARCLARRSAPDGEELFYLITQRAETPETAAHMADHMSRSITLVEQKKKIGYGYEPGVAWTVLQDLHRLHVRLKKNTTLLSLGDGPSRWRAWTGRAMPPAANSPATPWSTPPGYIPTMR